ncbi:G2/mitotic-specific cyclin-B [Microplitis demolitor]|uniref:G2/mitotic-specific cyclin-B n=1 Tax=Microplitis demolitor TaxID=69319 RepID=UPI0006D50A62|nr:G2/mitotic-specific cyclin-B [Microplitis demolitor]XP_014299578.1 G2/mitotic-specific cyclin-B [Microplitis demolitor]
MALRNRTAITHIVNQENVKNVKSTTTVSAQTRRAALGEIGNRVTIRSGIASKAGVPQKAGIKKPVVTTRQAAAVKPVVKAQEKLPVQIVKPVVKEIEEIKESAPVLDIKVDKPVQPIVIEDYKSTTTSSANCDAFSSDLLQVEDIDEADKNNPILVTIYSNDIYCYLRKLEAQYPIQQGYLAGQEVTEKMRSVLIDWLVEVHQQFRLLQETLYLTVAIIDRFLQSVRTITRKKLQLVGVAAMYIACKYEEMYAPDISDFVYITDNAYTKTEIIHMEMLIVRTLDYSFGRPLPLHFLRRYSKVGHATSIHHTMAKYFLEQCLISYNMCHYPPSLIAAAAMYLAFFVIGNDSEDEGKVIWTPTLAHYSTYTKEDIFPVVREIAGIIVNADKDKYQAVRKKYNHSKNMRISMRPELKSPSMMNLVNSKNLNNL